MSSVNIKIDNCLDCPHCVTGMDPDPHDSFCMDDMYSACTKVKNDRQNTNSNHGADRQEHKIITCAARPYQLRKESKVPYWCPLR